VLIAKGADEMDNRQLIWVLAGLLLVVVAGFGYTLTRGYDKKKEEVRAEAPGRAPARRLAHPTPPMRG
jgi:hypothetical protein